jgi:hypothetical protein
VDNLKTGQVSKRKPLETKKKSRTWFPGGRKKRRRILVLSSLIGTVTDKLKLERKVPGERRGELKK